MDETDEAQQQQQQNMVSNLPLLFANGYPTSLDKVSEKALETFIPFMVQCSLGNINVQGKNGDISEPEWWPEDVSFSIPLIKPKKFDGNWLEKLKEIVVICYQFHKSIFLLRFCYDLAAYEPIRLRFINNYNSTTSLYDRRCNKLLVTFRNENMSYDQPQRNRKTLLQKSRSQTSENNNNTQQMVEPALFDIYLCDNCDAELYSLEAITQHEKTCMQDGNDDDVIICETPPPDDNILDDMEIADITDKSNDEMRESFLLNFALSRNIPATGNLDSKFTKTELTKDDYYAVSGAKRTATAFERAPITTMTTINKSPLKNEPLKRMTRRNRTVYALSRCPTVALSSPAGQLMIRTSKALMTEDYLHERLDRMERFCHTPILSQGVIRPKFLSRKFQLPHTMVTYNKKASDQTIHWYTFPRRHFFSRYRYESFLFLNSLLLKRCRPITVRLRKLNERQLAERRNKNFVIKSLSISSVSSRSSSSSSRSSNSSNNSIKPKSAQAISRKSKIKKSEVVIDTIDLCSSDDDNENDDVDQAIDQDIKCFAEKDSIKSQTASAQAQFLGTEITITPISKPLQNELEDIRQKNKFEGNFLVSQTVPSQPKPLQPSVFLFSNYTTENVHLRNLTNHTLDECHSPLSITQQTLQPANSPLQQQLLPPTTAQQQKSLAQELCNGFQNQENVEQNIKGNSNSKNNIVNAIQNGGDDWLPTLNRTDRNNSSNKVIQIITCSSDSDVVLNKISSPNRIVSIDLTKCV